MHSRFSRPCDANRAVWPSISPVRPDPRRGSILGKQRNRRLRTYRRPRSLPGPWRYRYSLALTPSLDRFRRRQRGWIRCDAASMSDHERRRHPVASRWNIRAEPWADGNRVHRRTPDASLSTISLMPPVMYGTLESWPRLSCPTRARAIAMPQTATDECHLMLHSPEKITRTN